MPTQNNSTPPSKEVDIQHYYDHNNLSNLAEQIHSTLPPTYEQSTNPQYSPSSPNLDDLMQESLNYNNSNAAINNNNGSTSNSAYPINKDDKIGPSSPPIKNSLNSPVPSAPPVELIFDGESSPSLAPPPPVANPNFSNAFPNSQSNFSFPHHAINNPTHQTKQTELSAIKMLCNLLSPFKDKRNWMSLGYLLFWDLDFGLFCFMWIIFTFCISIPMMVIPPIGCTLLAWSVYSWRSLAHMEILAFDLVYPPSDPSQKLPSSSSLPPVYIQREPGQGCFNYLIQLLTDGFTVRSFAYFVFIKPWVSMLATTCCVMSIIIGVNFLILLPIFMPMYKDIVKMESKLGKNVLGLNNDDEINENGRVMVEPV